MPKVDYLGYTFKNAYFDAESFLSDYDNIKKYLLPDKIVNALNNSNLELSSSKCSGWKAMGYKFRLTYPNCGIFIYTDFKMEQGTHIVLSGTALRMFEIDRDELSLFVSQIEERCNKLSELCGSTCDETRVSFQVSRCDIAYDFEMSFSDFLEKFKSDCMLTKCRSSRLELDKKDRGTIYIGSRESACFIRIYDKSLEQHIKMNDIFGAVPDDLPDKWTRLEFEFKNDHNRKLANQSFYSYIKDDLSIGEFVLNFLRITETSGYKRTHDSAVLWEPYESLILSNKASEVEYAYIHSTSINLQYLQTITNLIITYCKAIPGLGDFLKSRFNISYSANERSKNYVFHVDKLLKLVDIDSGQPLSDKCDFDLCFD